MRFVSTLAIAASLALAHSTAHAHHSFAMFDLGKDFTVEAVIKEVQFTNPHVWLQILVKVVVPMAATGIIAAGVFSFVLAWNELLWAFILSGLETRTLPVAVAGLVTQQGTLIGPMAAATVLMSTPVIVLTFLVRRYLVTGLTFGSVK